MSHYQFEWPVRVYYEDTDAGGIVYYANYLKFLERARIEWLRSLGIEQDTWLAHNIAFVVRKVELDLKKAARFNEELIITVDVIKKKKASLMFKQNVLGKDGSVHCSAVVTAACVDNSVMKPVAIPTSILSRIETEV